MIANNFPHAFVVSDIFQVADFIVNSLRDETLEVYASTFEKLKQITFDKQHPPSYLIFTKLSPQDLSVEESDQLKNLLSDLSGSKNLLVGSPASLAPGLLEMYFSNVSNGRFLETPDLFGPHTTPFLNDVFSTQLQSVSQNKKEGQLKSHAFTPLFETEFILAIKLALFSASSRNKYFVLPQLSQIETKHLLSLSGSKLSLGPGPDITAGPVNLSSALKDLGVKREPLSRLTSSLDVEKKIQETVAKLSRSLYSVNIVSAPPPDQSPVSQSTFSPQTIQNSETDDELTLLRTEKIQSISEEVRRISQPKPSAVFSSEIGQEKKPKQLHLQNLKQLISIKKFKLSPRKFPVIAVMVLIIYVLSLESSFFIASKLLNFSSSPNRSFAQKPLFLKTALILAGTASSLSRPVLSIAPPRLKTHLLNITSLSTSINQYANYLNFSAQTTPAISEIYTHLIGEKEADVSQKIIQLTSLASEFDRLSRFGAETGNQDQLYSQTKIPVDTRTLRKKISKINTLLPGLGKIIGIGEQRVYLILLQNDTELRPTGGFIQTVGLLTLKNGQIIDLKTFDTYSLDGQLKGYVEPPSDLKKYLGESGWYLRDSNWDPDFSLSAQRAEWFLEKEIGRKVDGVISINTTSLKHFIGILGPLSYPPNPLTKDNFLERLVFKNEVPQDSQANDLLQSVVSDLYQKAKKATPLQQSLIVKTIFSALEEKDIQIYHHNNHDIFSRLAWVGSVKPDFSCAAPNCLVDSIAVIDTNVGVNKVNYFLTRSQDLNIYVSSDKIVYNLKVGYQNHSQSSQWPQGRYKNYLRFFIHPDSVIENVTLDDSDTPLEFETFPQHGLKVVALLVEVDPSRSSVIHLRYTLPRKVVPGTNYFLKINKQSGTSDQFKLVMTSQIPVRLFGSNLRLKEESSLSSQAGLTLPQILGYNTSLVQDLFLETVF